MSFRARWLRGVVTAVVALGAATHATAEFAGASPTQIRTLIPYTVVLNNSGILLLDGNGAAVTPATITSSPTVITVINRGTGTHVLSIAGPDVSGKHTSGLNKGAQAKLTVTFEVGNYTLTDTAGKSHKTLKLSVQAPKSVATGGSTGKIVTQGMDCSLDTHLCTAPDGTTYGY